MFGEEVTQMEREELPRLRRRIGIVLQDYRLLSHLTIAQNVALPLKVAGESQKEIDEKVLELLAWVGLSEYHAVNTPTCFPAARNSARPLRGPSSSKPDLLLADEPTGNLDPELALRFMYLFEALNKSGTTVVFATHDEHLISLFRYPVMRLKEGKLLIEQK